jgi:hypothetical protein
VPLRAYTKLRLLTVRFCRLNSLFTHWTVFLYATDSCMSVSRSFEARTYRAVLNFVPFQTMGCASEYASPAHLQTRRFSRNRQNQRCHALFLVIMASNAAFRMLVIMLVVIGIAIFARCFNQDPLEELLRNLTAPVCSLIPQYSNIKSL